MLIYSGGDDVSMALACALALNADEKARIDFILSDAPPTSGPAIGFQLAQNDPDSAVTIYFSSKIEILSAGTVVPDAGATAPLLALSFLRLGDPSAHREVSEILKNYNPGQICEVGLAFGVRGCCA